MCVHVNVYDTICVYCIILHRVYVKHANALTFENFVFLSGPHNSVGMSQGNAAASAGNTVSATEGGGRGGGATRGGVRAGLGGSARGGGGGGGRGGELGVRAAA
jgi:hypothetical protein